MNFTKLGLLFAFVTTAVAGCSTELEEDAEQSEGAATLAPAEVEVEIGRTKSFSGTFRADAQAGSVKIEFKVSKIDWDAKTAVWDTKVLSGQGATPDVALPVKIQQQRCVGCFSMHVYENGTQQAKLSFRSGTFYALEYFGAEGTDVTIKSPSSSSGGGSSGSSSGSCSVSCEGQVSACKDNVASKTSCTRAAFGNTPLPRCFNGLVFDFKSGGSCSAGR